MFQQGHDPVVCEIVAQKTGARNVQIDERLEAAEMLQRVVFQLLDLGQSELAQIGEVLGKSEDAGIVEAGGLA